MTDCKVCKTEKSSVDFRPNRRICKDCERKSGREYRQANKNKAREWAELNRDKMKELQAKWYIENKEKIRERFTERYHNESSSFKKVKNYRTAISHMISGTQKTNSYVECTKSELIRWLESSFEKGMTLENYGTVWVVDHVIPLDVAKNDDTFRVVAKWHNICPVPVEFNLKKNKYLNEEQIRKHLSHVQSYYDIHSLKPDEEYENYLQNTWLRGSP